MIRPAQESTPGEVLMRTATIRASILAVAAIAIGFAHLSAQQVEGELPDALVGAQAGPRTIELTPENLVTLTLDDSYEVQFLTMSVEQTRQQLRAERARLRSSFSLDISAPEFESISEEVYDSDLGRNIIDRQDSRRWSANFSIRQPLIVPFVGYPTDGYLSLNNRVYRYTQYEENDARDITYYNRWFVRYTQPLFQPNELKNSLEEAELDLEDAELDFRNDMINIVDRASDQYFELFEIAYEEVINSAYVEDLVAATEVARQHVQADPARSIEVDQISVELANAREEVQEAVTDFRLETSSLKTRLNLAASDSLYVNPTIQIVPVTVDIEEATEYALELTPRMRSLAIQQREREMNLEESEGQGSFRLDVELTYGREMRDPTFGQLWSQPENTYTIDVSAYIPIWDWGARDARVAASRINLDRTRLQIQQEQEEIVTDIENQVANLVELQARALTMQDNLALAAQISDDSLDGYRNRTISVVDLLQSYRRELDTAENFLDAYLGWRRALTRLQRLTYYDFEAEMQVLDRYEIDPAEIANFSAEL